MNWFNTPERVDAFLASAESWLDTPFSPNGNTKGREGGVSCQKLAGEIYREAGYDKPFNVPSVSIQRSRFSRGDSIVERWFALRPDFEIISTFTQLEVGDVIAIRVLRTVNHLGLYVGRGQFIHACDSYRVTYANLSDACWLTRWAFNYRPRP